MHIRRASGYQSANSVLINGEFRRDPAAKEAVEPSVHLGRVMDVAFDVLVARAGAFQAKARVVVPVQRCTWA